MVCLLPSQKKYIPDELLWTSISQFHKYFMYFKFWLNVYLHFCKVPFYFRTGHIDYRTIYRLGPRAILPIFIIIYIRLILWCLLIYNRICDNIFPDEILFCHIMPWLFHIERTFYCRLTPRPSSPKGPLSVITIIIINIWNAAQNTNYSWINICTYLLYFNKQWDCVSRSKSAAHIYIYI